MSLLAKMKPYTVSRQISQRDPATNQKLKSWQQIGSITASISPISRTPIDSQDRRFAEATDKLFSFDKAAVITEEDRLSDGAGNDYEIIWIDPTNKLLTATLKRQVFANA